MLYIYTVLWKVASLRQVYNASSRSLPVMLHCLCYVTSLGVEMSIGGSGRIVIEIDPQRKRDLYLALHRDGHTLKDWFLGRADEYLRHGGQLSIFDDRKDNAARNDSDKG
jgi:hypothetical protein